MRRYWREPQSSRVFRGAELPRLMTAIVMLAVLYMLIVRARDANTWRWLANDEGSSSNAPQADQKSPPVVSPLPDATGPTDEDSEQAEEAEQEFQVLVDGGLTLQKEEMEPYDRLVFWVKNQSMERLLRRARSDLLFTNFYDEPDKHRGQIVALEMNVRRILDAGKNRDGTQLHEVWGFTTESRDRLYVAIVVDLPKGMPIGPSVYEKVRFAGYFLKLQGYHAAGAKPGAVPDKSPLLIGRLEWEPIVAPPVDDAQEWTWGLSLLAIIGLALGLRFAYCKLRARKPAARTSIQSPETGEVVPIEQWLERSDFNSDGNGNNVNEENE